MESWITNPVPGGPETQGSDKLDQTTIYRAPVSPSSSPAPSASNPGQGQELKHIIGDSNLDILIKPRQICSR